MCLIPALAIQAIKTSGADAQVSLRPELARADLGRLVNALRDGHPATVAGFSPQQQRRVDEAYAVCTCSVSVAEFFLRASRIVCSMNDVHTMLACADETHAADIRRVDLGLQWFSDGLFVTGDSGDLRKGDKILSFGGQNPDRLVDAMSDIISHENRFFLKSGYAVWRLKTEKELAILGALGADGRVGFTCQRGASTINAWFPLVASLTSATNGIARTANQAFFVDKDRGIGVFTLNQCIVDTHYRQTLKDFFSAVHASGVRDVVVDLRRNSGGDSRVANLFLGYLPVSDWDGFGMTVRYSETLRESVRMRMENARRNGEANEVTRYEQILAKPDGVETFPSVRQKNRRAQDAPPFDGRVWVLISETTGSSAVMFASLLQDNGLALLVGVTAGGQPTSYGEQLCRVKMPASKLLCNFSCKRFIRPAPFRGEELKPDYFVSTSSADFMAGRDPQLEWICELIRDRDRDDRKKDEKR